MVAEPWASDLQPEWQAVRETSRRKRKRRMARHVLQRGVVHLGGEGANLIARGQAPRGSASQNIWFGALPDRRETGNLHDSAHRIRRVSASP